MQIIDAHLDLAYLALRHTRDLLLPIDELRQFEERTSAQAQQLNGTAIVTLPALRAAGVRLVFGSLFVPPISEASSEPGSRFLYSSREQSHSLAMEQMDYYHRLADEVEYVRLVTDLTSLNEVMDSPDSDQEQLLGIVPMMEGADSIREPAEAEMWYARGLRMIALAWEDTSYSAGAWRSGGGLTNEGHLLLEIMAELNFILDLSHMSHQASLQALDSYDGPIVASHSNVRQLVPGQRQLSDDQIIRIAERDGVIGVVFYNSYLKAGHRRGEPREAVRLSHVVAHIDHICQRCGNSLHVGLGTDFDGGFGLEDVPLEIHDIDDLNKLSTSLGEKGYSVDDIQNIMSHNWLRILKESLPD